MSTIFQSVKDQQLQSRKDKNEIKTSLLTTLIGEISIVAKNDGNRPITDADVIKIIQKFITNINDTISILTKKSMDFSKFSTEKEILLAFLPKQLSEDEIKSIVQSLISEKSLSGIKSLGVISKEFKEKYNGQFDSATLSSIAKSLLV